MRNQMQLVLPQTTSKATSRDADLLNTAARLLNREENSLCKVQAMRRRTNFTTPELKEGKRKQVSTTNVTNALTIAMQKSQVSTTNLTHASTIAMPESQVSMTNLTNALTIAWLPPRGNSKAELGLYHSLNMKATSAAMVPLAGRPDSKKQSRSSQFSTKGSVITPSVTCKKVGA